MKLVFARVALLVAACLTSTNALAWRSTLYPANWQPPTVNSASFETNKLIQDFSYAGYGAGEAPIPNVAGPVFNVTQAPYNADPSGIADATGAIQTAINTAQNAGGGVVFMPAGLYRISPQGSATYALRVVASGVVLRGAGVGQTFLLNTATNLRGKTVISVEGNSAAAFYSGGAGSTPLRENLMGPTQLLPVTSTAGFATGQWVVVRADCTDDWITEHNEPGWLGYGSTLRGPAYFRRVVAVNSQANTLTVDAPTRYYLKTRDNARVVRLSTGPVMGVGLEDFSLGNVQHPGTGWKEEDYNYSTNAAYDVHSSYLIKVVRARDSWVRRVASFQAAGNTTTCHLLSNGILVNDSSRVTITEVHLQRPQYGGGGGNGYMYRLQSANDCLVQDSKATFSRHGFVLSHMGSAGNVFHRCVDTTTGRQTGDTGSQTTGGSGSDHHMHFSHSNLIDASTGDSSWWEARYRPFGSVPLHNLTSAHGVYWNLLGTGSGAAYVVRTEQSRYGYAIGTRGTRSAIDRPTIGGTKCDPLDHAEGAGLGDTLEPFSLYEDQLARRLGLPEIILPDVLSIAFPSNSVRMVAEVLVGRQAPSAGAFTAQWQHLAGPGVVFFSSLTETNPLVTFTGRGAHELELTVTSNGRSAIARVTVILEPDRTFGSESVACVADTFVRDGSYAGDNYGTQSTLSLKKSSPGFNRQAFLRFDLTTITNPIFTRAFLELQTGSPATASTAATITTRSVTNDTWGELSLTWTNQPILGPILNTWVMSTGGLERIEVTTTALAEAGGDGQLSLGLMVASQPGDAVYSYYARESAADRRPRLVLESALAALPFADWITNYPALPPGLRGPADDPEGDGWNNAEEYFYVRNPALVETESPLQYQLEADGFALIFPQRKGLPPDFQYYIETTELLPTEAWQPAPGVAFSPLADLGDALRMKALVPADPGAAQRYFRLRFHLAP